MQSFIVEELLNSARVFWLDQEILIEEINKAARKLGEEDSNILKIILFGSLAERRGTPGSDTDILIILKTDDKVFINRIPEWREKFHLNFQVEVFPYTERELDTPLVLEALKKGIVLFERKSEPFEGWLY